MKKTPLLPILSYSTGAGWMTHGHARSIAGAAAVIRKAMGDATRLLITNNGFELLVGLRSDLHIEINGGPKGFVWSVGKAVKTSGS